MEPMFFDRIEYLYDALMTSSAILTWTLSPALISPHPALSSRRGGKLIDLKNIKFDNGFYW